MQVANLRVDLSSGPAARTRRSMPNDVPMSWMVERYEHLPIFVASGEGATFTDVDGHRYFDTNVGDMRSTFCGLNPEAVAEVVARQARRGMQYLLPVEDAVWLAEELTACPAGGHGSNTAPDGSPGLTPPKPAPIFDLRPKAPLRVDPAGRLERS